MSDSISRGSVVAVRHQPRHRVRRWAIRGPNRRPPLDHLVPDLVRHWNAEAAREDDTGRRFWGFVTTVPLTLLTLANLIAAWRAPAPVRGWWLAAAIAAVADRVTTCAYFIPTMIRLMRAPDSPESVAVAIQWAHLNYLRLAILLAAWLTALKAFSLP